MSVRFKFRSSPNFDSVDINGLPSISVRDLKSKIVQNKKLNVCQDFDLVFSDHITGEEYLDEDSRIPCGSSVIIKRVPAGSVPSNKVRGGTFGDLATINVNTMKASLPKVVETVDFDDFGDELCPVPQPTLSGIDLNTNKKYSIGDEEINFEVKRCSELPKAECQKLDGSDISEAVPRGHFGIGNTVSETKARPNAGQTEKFLKPVDPSSPAVQNSDFPPELKCFLCHTYFKNAVMIPCCQRSFCEQCISQVLAENARCPKCFSTKCKVGDLLPNVSLRHAIVHFLESQLHITGSENALNEYAPDGESGIQAKDVSCAISIHQKGHHSPTSISETGYGSNQVAVEAVGGTDRKRYGSAHQLDMKKGTGNLAQFDELHGESKPIRDEAESNIMTNGAQRVKVTDGKKMEAGKPKKGGRTCYTCGSPDHLMRDCPVAPSQHPMFPMGHSMYPGAMPAYPSPYWNGSSFPQMRPYAGAYGNAGMMPFNPTMVPGTPYPGTMFMQPCFGGSAAYRGYMGMGALTTPMRDDREHHVNRHDLDAEDWETRPNFSSEKLIWRQSSDENDDANRRCRADELRPRKSYDRERSVSPSDESFGQKSNRKHRHRENRDAYLPDERHEKSSRSSSAARGHSSHHNSNRSRSDLENLRSSSSRERGGYKGGHHKKVHDRREHYGSDSSRDHRPSNKEKDSKRKRDAYDDERHKEKHHKHSESGSKQKLPANQKEKDSSRRSRHPEQHDPSHDRRPMVDKESDGKAEAEHHHRHHHHHHKRKRDY